MKIEELYQKTLIQSMNITEVKVNTNDRGDVINIIVKYVPDKKVEKENIEEW